MKLPAYTISEVIANTSSEKSYYIGTFEDTEAQDILWPHRHEFYSIIWFTSGSGTNVIDFDAYAIQPNRIFFMHPKQIHNWSYAKGTTGYTLVLDKHFNTHIPEQLKLQGCFDLPITQTNFITALYQNIIEETLYSSQAQDSIIEAGLTYLLHQLSKYTSSTAAHALKPKLLLQFSEMVNANLSEYHTVQHYAQTLRISVEKLNDLCKTYYGQSPKAFILDQKITEAKRLLYFTSLTITEIAYTLGFEDSSYFSRIFKQKTQQSPTAFKSMFKNPSLKAKVLK